VWCGEPFVPVDEMDGDVVDGDGTGHNEEA
jgi:hypothetical protein